MMFCVSIAEKSFFASDCSRPTAFAAHPKTNESVLAGVDASVVASHAVSVMQALPVAAVARQCAAQASSASAGSIAIRKECLSWLASYAVGQIAQCLYYFFMIVVVIRYKTKATARRALMLVVCIFVDDTIAIAVWTSFHVCASKFSLPR